MNRTKLGNLIKIKHGYAFKSENYVSKSPYTLVTLANISSDNNFQFNESKATYYGAEFPKEFILDAGDLIMPLTEQVIGLFGNSAFIPMNHNHTFVLNQRVGKVIIDESKTDKYYIHYLLSTDSVRKQMESRASGTRQRNISPEDIYDVIVDVPPLSIQRRIGKCLYLLEEIINANIAINDNLQEQIKLLYDYWFTQFDYPDSKGNPYKTSGGKMVLNTKLKRLIPEGWNVVNLLEYVKWESNSQPPKSEFIYQMREGYVRFIQNRDYDSNSYKTFIPFKKSLSTVTKYDILMDKYGDAGRVRYGIEGVFNVALGKICVNNPIAQEYVRSFFESSSIYTYLHNSCMASTRASLSEANLATLDILVPPDELLSSYQKNVRAIRQLILKNKEENEFLASYRDWLLPMLMNGQVTITD